MTSSTRFFEELDYELQSSDDYQQNLYKIIDIRILEMYFLWRGSMNDLVRMFFDRPKHSIILYKRDNKLTEILKILDRYGLFLAAAELYYYIVEEGNTVAFQEWSSFIASDATQAFTEKLVNLFALNSRMVTATSSNPSEDDIAGSSASMCEDEEMEIIQNFGNE